jgi:hypothetical protein
MDNRVIFGWYRAGTKLLADLHKDAGYFNFGEFFNCFSCDIVYDTIPYAKRLPIETQYLERQQRKRMDEAEMDRIKGIEVSKRVALFNEYKDETPSIVTPWWIDMYYSQDVFTTLQDRYFLCPVRKSKEDQLLSGLLTIYNLNFNGEVESKPIRVHMEHVDMFYTQLKNTIDMQYSIVRNKMGRYIDFDKVIQGTEDIGFDYTVKSSDQHENLHKFFLNLDEVLERIHLNMIGDNL